MRALEAHHPARAFVPGPRSARVAVASVAVALALGLSCAPTTHVVADWKAPNVGSLVIHRPLVVFQHQSEALRRSVEDALAKRIPGSVPSYQVIPTDEIMNVDAVQGKVRSAGFDTVIVTRLAGVTKDIDVVPGAVGAGPLWGAWDPMWSDVYSPGYLREVTVVTLETLLYTLDPAFGTGDGELVWASRTETFDPKNLGDTVVRAAIKAMEEDGFVVAANAPAPRESRLW